MLDYADTFFPEVEDYIIIRSGRLLSTIIESEVGNRIKITIRRNGIAILLKELYVF